MNKLKIVQQVQQSECGLCCIAMILRYYNSYETLEELRDFLDAGRDGLSMNDLKSVLALKNFDTSIIKCNLKKIDDIMALNDITMPCIAFWNKDHFVVISKVTKNYVEIFDSAKGRMKIRHVDFLNSFSGYLLIAKPNEKFGPKKEKSKNWSFIIKQLCQEKKLIFTVSILSLLSYSITIAFPKLTQWFIDNYIQQKTNNNIIDLDYLFLLLLISILIAIIIIGTRNICLVIMKIRTEKIMVRKVFNHLINLPYSFFETRSQGDLITRLGSINYVKDFILDKLIGAIFDFGIGLVLLVYIATISYKILIVVLFLILINCVSILLTARSIENLNKEEIINISEVNGIQVETIYSIFTTKILRLEKSVFKNWETSFIEYLSKRKKREYYQLVSVSVSSILNIVSPLIILFVGYLSYSKGIVSIGEIVISQSFIVTLLSISSNMIQTYNTYMIASNYLDRVVDITNKEIELIEGEAIDNIDHININNVDFSYTKHGKAVLKGINIDIDAGEKIAIVGETGCGKSTLGKLIMGLYEPTYGSIEYNHINISQLDKRKLLDLMTIVPQDVYIYSKNIINNIKLEREGINEDDVVNAAKIACIHDEIINFPLGYRTMLSGMGMNLSGGQRQRIAIARAILTNPNLILFDEGTSFLDNITEKRIMKNLKSSECTMVIIAHRLETIIDCDRIYFMRNGMITESGSHEELMRLKGEYYKLYRTNHEDDVEYLA